MISICIPTYNRPTWLERALLSVTQQSDGHGVEIVVSDNSTTAETRAVVERCLSSWGGAWQYMHNEPGIPATDNLNQAISHASRAHVLVLSDDDYLLPGALAVILSTLAAQPGQAAYLFGVQVVNDTGQVIKRQSFKRATYLPPQAAVARLLSNSSFVRLPAIIFERKALLACDLFDPTIKPCDFDLYLKLFRAHGVLCLPTIISAYRIHQHTITMGMFNPEVIELLASYFDAPEQARLFSHSRLTHYKALFLHQYILAGVYRNLRWHGRQAARTVFGLLEHEAVRNLTTPKKWWPLRALFTLVLGPPQLSRRNDPGPKHETNL
jgi:glycosyltransferase involved in cell wall biosynthesis